MPNVNASCLPFHVLAEEMYVSAMSVPCQVPVVIVPRVVILLEPAHVETAVFSTLFNVKSLFSSLADRPSKVVPFTRRKSLSTISVPHLITFVFPMPNVNVACLPSICV